MWFTRTKDQVERERGNRGRTITKRNTRIIRNMHIWEGHQKSGTLWRNYLNELPIKVCKFRRWFDESYFLLDRSCTGSTPRPCGTLSDIHHRLHTWIRLIARSVPSSWQWMFHAFWLGSNSLKHKPKKEPSWPMFQQDHHVKGCLKYLQVRDSGVPESYQPIVMPSSLDTQHHYRECPPAVPKILTRKLFQMVKCLKFNKQDQNSKHVITNTPGKESQIYAAVVGLVQVLLLLRSSTHTHKNHQQNQGAAVVQTPRSMPVAPVLWWSQRHRDLFCSRARCYSLGVRKTTCWWSLNHTS